MLGLRRSLVSSQRNLRWFSAQNLPNFPTEGEQRILDKLNAQFEPSEVRVQDISGGCGTFYAITITSPAFKGLSTLKQHRLVTGALKQEMEGIHGVQIKTIPTQ